MQVHFPHSASLLAIGLLALPATAQLTVVIPAGMDVAEGNTSNAFPWGRGGSGLRIQNIYDAANFTSQGITFPIQITGLRYRPNGNAASLASTYPVGGTVSLSTSPIPWSAATQTFASQQGPDLTVCFSGPISWPAAAAAPGPAPFLISVPFTTPFVYDPSGGDLNIETDLPIQTFTGSALQLDVHGTGSQSSRVFLSTGYVNGGPNATTTFAPTMNHGVVVEISYVPIGGGTVATRLPYGAGCYDRASASFYQQFTPGTFNLSNSSMLMVPSGNGYAVLPGGNSWWAPVGTPLPLTDNAVSAPQSLGFSFPYRGGSTSQVHISSNGFVWLQPSTNHGCCAVAPVDLVAMGPRICPLWTDLNPALGGSVVFDVDPTNGAAYATFTNVPEQRGTGVNTFQVAFFSTGLMEVRWQNCAVTALDTLVGWSPGNGARNPGSTNLRTSMPFLTMPDSYPLALGANPRPVLGNNVVMTTTNIPAGSPLGIVVFSLSRLNPPIDLASLGMPGCQQHVGTDTATAFLPVGTSGTLSFLVPNNPVLTGLHVYCQSATFSPAVNLLGVLASNGVDLGVGTL